MKINNFKNCTLTFKQNNISDNKPKTVIETEKNTTISRIKRESMVDNLFMSGIATTLLFLYSKQKEINNKIMELKTPTQELIKETSEKVSKNNSFLNKKNGGFIVALACGLLIFPGLLNNTLNKWINHTFPIEKEEKK
ncbi:MAG: hypothetical protein WCK67_05780 [bacterium]